MFTWIFDECREAFDSWSSGESYAVKPGRIMEQETKELRICRKCLTRDLVGQEEYFRTLRDRIENLDIDIKTPEALYEKRLAVCRECDMLFQAMCRKCGCYVELRAAVKDNVCPWEKW